MKKYKRNYKIRFDYPRVKLNDGISIFFYNPDTGKDHVSNYLGCLIWHIMDKPKSVLQIVDVLHQMNIPVHGIDIVEDVRKLLNIMEKQEIIIVMK